MAKIYRPHVPEQDLLLPPSLRERLPENHLAFFVCDLIDQLDLSAITSAYEDEERAASPGEAAGSRKCRCTATCVGVFSSRKIEQRLVEDVAFSYTAVQHVSRGVNPNRHSATFVHTERRLEAADAKQIALCEAPQIAIPHRAIEGSNVVCLVQLTQRLSHSLMTRGRASSLAADVRSTVIHASSPEPP